MEPSETSAEETKGTKAVIRAATPESVDDSLRRAESRHAEETAPERLTVVCDNAELDSDSYSSHIPCGQRARSTRLISDDSSINSSFDMSYEMYPQSSRASPLNNSIYSCISQVTPEHSLLYHDSTHEKKKSKCGGCDNCLAGKFYNEQKKFARSNSTKRFLFYYNSVGANFNRLSDVVYLTNDVKLVEELSSLMQHLDSYFSDVVDKFEVECFPANFSL